MLIVIVLGMAIVCAIAAEGIAKGRGRSPTGYGLLGFFLGPLGVLIAAVTPADRRLCGTSIGLARGRRSVAPRAES